MGALDTFQSLTCIILLFLVDTILSSRTKFIFIYLVTTCISVDIVKNVPFMEPFPPPYWIFLVNF